MSERSRGPLSALFLLVSLGFWLITPLCHFSTVSAPPSAPQGLSRGGNWAGVLVPALLSRALPGLGFCSGFLHIQTQMSFCKPPGVSQGRQDMEPLLHLLAACPELHSAPRSHSVTLPSPAVVPRCAARHERPSSPALPDPGAESARAAEPSGAGSSAVRLHHPHDELLPAGTRGLGQPVPEEGACLPPWETALRVGLGVLK